MGARFLTTDIRFELDLPAWALGALNDLPTHLPTVEARMASDAIEMGGASDMARRGTKPGSAATDEAGYEGFPGCTTTSGDDVPELRAGAGPAGAGRTALRRPDPGPVLWYGKLAAVLASVAFG